MLTCDLWRNIFFIIFRPPKYNLFCIKQKQIYDPFSILNVYCV